MTTLTRWNPSRSWGRPFHRWNILGDVERMMEWEPYRYSSWTRDMEPRMDVYEHEDELVVTGEFPGVTRKDLDISLEGDTLRIKAEKKREEAPEGATYYACERCYGSYYRSYRLPYAVDESRLTATFENGVLEIRLPKAESAKPKHIAIKATAPRLKKAAKT